MVCSASSTLALIVLTAAAAAVAAAAVTASVGDPKDQSARTEPVGDARPLEYQHQAASGTPGAARPGPSTLPAGPGRSQSLSTAPDPAPPALQKTRHLPRGHGRNGRLPGKHHGQVDRLNWRPTHHIRRRSFDSINTGELQGMNQNFVGGELYGPKSQYPYTNSRRSAFYRPGKRDAADLVSEEDPLPFSLGGKYDSEDIDDMVDSYDTGPNGHRLPLHAELEPLEKRGFDSISRWNGGVSGLSQNFIGPKRADFNTFRRDPSHYVDSFFGISDSSTPWQRDGVKKSFDSISNGPLHSFYQNHLTKKDESDLHRWLPGGFRDNYILKRGPEELDDGVTSTDDAELDMNYPLPQDKRSFDSISQGQLSGIRQNHIGKRSFDSIPTGGALGDLRQNFIHNRLTDFLNSEEDPPNDFENGPGTSKRFDSISRSRLNGMRQNFISKRFPYSRYYSDDQGPDKARLDPILISLLNGPFPHFVSRRSVNSFDQSNPNQFKKRQLDSMATSSLGGMRQNHVLKKSSGLTSQLRHVLSNFPQKKSFDSVGFTRIGGMAQNFISKRILDSIHDGRIGGFNQNFIGKRSFDSIDRGHLGGLRQNFISKRFDSIGNTNLSGMGRNFVSKRTFDSINHNALGGMRQNFIGYRKRHFDSLNSGPLGGFQQNFVSKKNFDSINYGRLHGMTQNFISKRLKYFSGKDKEQHPREETLRISDLMAEAGNKIDSIPGAGYGSHLVSQGEADMEGTHNAIPGLDNGRQTRQERETHVTTNKDMATTSKDSRHR
ncbi:hypothetical protein EGW08_010670 [Elysia chlorotica]|uniref:Uncharacterized protein n=1 Tax=Elysia chlorotica TaxID=188477 RepID=A0A433TJ18_ELYCH|nr:hypothetical protein EGW08_010670 [Elysia chlorotica]